MIDFAYQPQIPPWQKSDPTHRFIAQIVQNSAVPSLQLYEKMLKEGRKKTLEKPTVSGLYV